MTNPVFERIKETGDLPSPQGVALRLLHLLADDRSTIAQVVATVEADPAIVSRLLKLVNSPLAGVSRTVVSVTSAVTLLGLRTVRTLALGHSLISSFRTGKCGAFDFELFWSQSLARAVAARGLTGDLGGTSPDETFTVALLSKVGKLALATVFPTAYDELLSRLRDDPSASLGELECRQFGLDHNELAALMIADWHLPALFCEAVRNQDSVERAGETPSRTLDVARILRVSDAIATLLVNPTPYQDDVSTMLGAAQKCGVSQTVISAAYESARETWLEACAVFSVTANDTVSLPELHCRASREYRRVLIVDDDPDCLRLLRSHLSNAGYEVFEASNGVEALRILHAEGCRIVVTDWNMPEMDGLQLCRAIREDEGTGFIHIVMMTAADSAEKMAQAFEAGADDFLQKPFRSMELFARLKVGVRAVGADAKVAVQQLALFKNNAELALLNTKLEQSATTDELTGLGNRRAAMDRLPELHASLERHQTALACILIDVDHFKSVNDTFGHEAGDRVLRETANALRRAARIDEPVFRLGGEEFLVLCPSASAGNAVQGAERFRLAVASSAVQYGDDQISVTVSCGVAEWGPDTKTTDELLRMADQALYCAKRSGRNQVCAFGCVDGKPGPACCPSSALLPPAINGQLSRYKILVVDDDPDCRKLCKLHLSRAGHEVIEAESGEAALEAVQQVNPDVVVMDVMMPGMNGIECTRQLKANQSTADIPILISSGRGDASDTVEGFNAGADEYVTKPVHPREFIARVEGLARSLRKTRQLKSANAELAAANAERGEQARAMGILFELAHALNLVQSEEAILKEIIDATTQLLLSQRVSVMFPTEDGAVLRIAQSVGIDQDTAQRIRVPKGRLVAGRVFETGERIVRNTPNSQDVGGNRYDSSFFASVPLASAALGTLGRVIGVLNVTERYGHKPFDDRDLQYLDLIANLACSTIEHFRDQQSRLEAQQAIVTGLATLAEYRDADTGRHLERVTNYALIIAEDLQKHGPYADTVNATFLADLRDAMPLHDIGKVGVSDAILLKRGPLSPDERKAIEKHPSFGANAIQAVIDRAPTTGFMVMARDIAHCHHERVDGTGYPSGLAGDRIPLAARIASVADVYDALTTKRPYREAMTHEQAVNHIIEGRGSQFDSDVVHAFLRSEQEIVKLSIKLGDVALPAQKPVRPDRKLVTAIS